MSEKVAADYALIMIRRMRMTKKDNKKDNKRDDKQDTKKITKRMRTTMMML